MPRPTDRSARDGHCRVGSPARRSHDERCPFHRSCPDKPRECPGARARPGSEPSRRERTRHQCLCPSMFTLARSCSRAGDAPLANHIRPVHIGAPSPVRITRPVTGGERANGRAGKLSIRSLTQWARSGHVGPWRTASAVPPWKRRQGEGKWHGRRWRMEVTRAAAAEPAATAGASLGTAEPSWRPERASACVRPCSCVSAAQTQPVNTRGGRILMRRISRGVGGGRTRAPLPRALVPFGRRLGALRAACRERTLVGEQPRSLSDDPSVSLEAASSRPPAGAVPRKAGQALGTLGPRSRAALMQPGDFPLEAQRLWYG